MKKTFRTFLLIIGAIFVLVGLGYNVYGWNTEGKTDYNLMLFGIALMLIAIFLKEEIE